MVVFGGAASCGRRAGIMLSGHVEVAGLFVQMGANPVQAVVAGFALSECHVLASAAGDVGTMRVDDACAWRPSIANPSDHREGHRSSTDAPRALLLARRPRPPRTRSRGGRRRPAPGVRGRAVRCRSLGDGWHVAHHGPHLDPFIDRLTCFAWRRGDVGCDFVRSRLGVDVHEKPASNELLRFRNGPSVTTGATAGPP